MKADNTMAMLIIDPQNDFCDVADEAQGFHPALPVPGATEDMRRMANLISRLGNRIDRIVVTLDSHSPYDIAHPVFWINQAGESPLPFTTITEGDLANGIWLPRDENMMEHVHAYVRTLREKGKYELRIWPEHCIVGGWGHNVQADVREALDGWARQSMKRVNYVSKGMNPATEHYSAVAAEVPDDSDPETQVNWRIVSMPHDADVVVVGGEALSHCVASTIRDMVGRLPSVQIAKMVLLTDCMSPVPGFEQEGEAFINEMLKLGMQTAVSSQFEL